MKQYKEPQLWALQDGLLVLRGSKSFFSKKGLQILRRHLQIIFLKTSYKLNLIGNGRRKGVTEILYVLIEVLVTWVHKSIKAK